jgi:hypothetical protein
MTAYDDAEWQQIVNGMEAENPDGIPGQFATSPYGSPQNTPRTGLTKRGKAALGVGAAVIASISLIGYQHYSANAAEADMKGQELALKQQELRIEELKELNKANAATQKVQETHDAALQKQIKACVEADKGLIGKQLGVTYSSVKEDCQDQYGNSSAGADMQEAASATDTGGGGISPSLLLGIGAGGALLIGVAANRGRRNNAA